jgi:hypothetical protein
MVIMQSIFIVINTSKLDYIHNNPVKIELLLCQKIIITVLPETMLV